MERVSPHADPSPLDGASPLDDSELETLDHLLEEAPGGDAMMLEELDGFLAALACGAEVVPPEEYLPEILGAQPEGGASSAPSSRLLSLIARHAAATEAALAAEQWAPVLAHDERGDPDGVAWAVGFLRGVELRADSWDAMLAEEGFEDVLQAAESIASTLDDDADGPTPGRRERLALVDQMIADATDAFEFFRPFRQAGTLPQQMRGNTVRNAAPRPGRNDPCPCGSGRKYKHCHGR